MLFSHRLSTLSFGAMVAAVLKMYFIGTLLSVFAALLGMVDPIGGLMYVQDRHYTVELDQQTQRRLSSSDHQGRSSVTKNIGS